MCIQACFKYLKTEAKWIACDRQLNERASMNTGGSDRCAKADVADGITRVYAETKAVGCVQDGTIDVKAGIGACLL